MLKERNDRRMNMILCGRNCRYQKDGYCCLDGRAVITNAVASPCCYFEERREHGKHDKNR